MPFLDGAAGSSRTVVPIPTEADGEGTALGRGVPSVTVAGGADTWGLPGAPVAGLEANATLSADSGDALTYSLLDDAAGRFAIDAATGVILVKDPRRLGRDASRAHVIVVRATDSSGAVVERSVLVPVLDIIG